MTPTAPLMTREEAIERGHKARSDAARAFVRMFRAYVAARFGKAVTA